jgi:hypothetical protein
MSLSELQYILARILSEFSVRLEPSRVVEEDIFLTDRYRKIFFQNLLFFSSDQKMESGDISPQEISTLVHSNKTNKCCLLFQLWISFTGFLPDLKNQLNFSQMRSLIFGRLKLFQRPKILGRWRCESLRNYTTRGTTAKINYVNM